jgi:hypothetical protein
MKESQRKNEKCGNWEGEKDSNNIDRKKSVIKCSRDYFVSIRHNLMSCQTIYSMNNQFFSHLAYENFPDFLHVLNDGVN